MRMETDFLPTANGMPLIDIDGYLELSNGTSFVSFADPDETYKKINNQFCVHSMSGTIVPARDVCSISSEVETPPSFQEGTDEVRSKLFLITREGERVPLVA
jgi:hypothetical protein